MKYEVYEKISVNDSFDVFDFVSIGRKGIISKRIVFTETEWSNVYNLSFGDVDDGGEISDYTISDNGDRNKILATVVKVVRDYTQRYPDRWILFIGSTYGRTRLYRMVISLYFEELSKEFDIYADADGKFIPFIKDLKVSAFLIKRKLFNFVV